MAAQGLGDAVLGHAKVLLEQSQEIWLAGGWAMIAIAVLAIVLFTLGMTICLRLLGKGFLWVPERRWRRWIDFPAERRGSIGRMIDFVTGGTSLEETSVFFDELRQIEVVPYERDLKVMKVCVGAAPLLGLLGTVTGMLSTFDALATGSGGDKTMALVAKGISEALITTETGLVVALIGLFFQYQLKRLHERYKAFLVHLETVCTQGQYGRERDHRDDAARRAARATVVRMLHERLALRPGGEASARRAGEGQRARDAQGGFGTVRSTPATAGRNG